jgi:hypothetical protein
MKAKQEMMINELPVKIQMQFSLSILATCLHPFEENKTELIFDEAAVHKGIFRITKVRFKKILSCQLCGNPIVLLKADGELILEEDKGQISCPECSQPERMQEDAEGNRYREIKIKIIHPRKEND